MAFPITLTSNALKCVVWRHCQCYIASVLGELNNVWRAVGMMPTAKDKSTGRKPCFSSTVSTLCVTWTDVGANPVLPAPWHGQLTCKRSWYIIINQYCWWPCNIVTINNFLVLTSDRIVASYGPKLFLKFRWVAHPTYQTVRCHNREFSPACYFKPPCTHSLADSVAT